MNKPSHPPLPLMPYPGRRAFLRASAALHAVYLAGCGGSSASEPELVATATSAGAQPTPPPPPTQAPTPAPTPAATPAPTPAPAPAQKCAATPAPSPAPTPPSAALSPPAPAWVPPVGTAADLTFNTVDQAAGKRTGFWAAWSGVAWAPWWGRYGSIIAAGGGHADGDQNDLYRVDIENRVVTKIKDAATSYLKTSGERAGDNADGHGNGLVNPSATGWMWSDVDPASRAVQVGQPFTSHFYSHLVALPPDAIPGRSDGLHGWLYTPGRRSLPRGGQRGVFQAHALAMGVAPLWELHGSGATTNAEHGGAAYDPQRKRVWYLRTGPTTTFYYRDMATGAQGSQSMCGSSGVFGYYKILEWSSAHAVLLLFGGNSTAELNVIDPAAGMIYTPAQSGPAPTVNPSGAWAWSDTWNAIVYHAGDGSNTFHFLKPSGANPRTSDWVWSSQTVSGTVYAGYRNPAYNRLRHASGLGNVLVWCAQCELPVQMIHVQAP